MTVNVLIAASCFIIAVFTFLVPPIGLPGHGRFMTVIHWIGAVAYAFCAFSYWDEPLVAVLWGMTLGINLAMSYFEWHAGRTESDERHRALNALGTVGTRLSLAWHVFRGRPLAYRIHIEDGGIVFRESRSWAVDCVVIGARDAAMTWAEGVTDSLAIGVTAIGTGSIPVTVEGKS